MSLSQIRVKLSSMGLKISEKALGRIFQNLFYCGLITSALIPGEVIEGHHEAMVSQDVFLKVHELMNNNNFGYKITPTHDSLWLKNFIICHVCHIPYTGYKHTKNTGQVYFYYKCNTRACKKNRRDYKVNNSFLEFLKQFELDPKLKVPILTVMKEYFSELHKDHLEEFTLVEANLKGIQTKIEHLDEKYVSGEIEKDLYNKLKDKFEIEKKSVSEKIGKSEISISNLNSCLEKVTEICSNLLEFWHLLNIEKKK